MPETDQAPVAATPAIAQDVADYCQQLADKAQAASLAMMSTPDSARNAALLAIADALEANSEHIQKENALDLSAGKENGLAKAMLERLALDEARIQKIAEAVRQVAAQDDPIGAILEGRTLPNGIRLEKRRVPMGSILIIFESRPNVTVDAAALCIKSGNATILRGGKEAVHSNRALAEAVREGLAQGGLPADAVQLVETTDRAAVGELLKKEGQIDLCIPRGGESLIRAVVEQSRIPVIKHYTGNCHTYVHADADAEMAVDICVNAKTHRTGVCNATETILLHKALVPNGTAAKILRELADQGVEIRGDDTAKAVYRKTKPATREDWATEYLDMIVAVKFVDSLPEAVHHINQYGSKHTDAIITQAIDAAEEFVQTVDTANAFINCSTRFSDGGEYGLGAEIGISTDKLHARGPMGAADLTTYKWIGNGSGQVRN